VIVGDPGLGAAEGVAHAFLTRRGGVSEGAFASLNCSLSSGDAPARVAENRARAAARLDLPPEALVTAYQHHGADCAVVEAPWRPTDRPRADALATNRPGIALGVLTADCAPVLLADAAARVVAAAHAGWRGALSGVVEAAVAAMLGLGARPERIVAAVGPAIGPRSYEVGDDLVAAFANADAANARFFTAAERAGHAFFDLPAYVAARLAALGLAAVAVTPHDTCADEARFFSYRRTCRNGGGAFGCQLSVIALRA